MYAVDERHLNMTVEEFLAWEGGDPDLKYELIHGEPVAMAPSREVHGTIQVAMARLIENHLIDRGSRCRTITEPGIIPRLNARRNYRIPDLVVTCASPEAGRVAVPEPVLLIEILSVGNDRKTREKVALLSSIPSLREILLIQSEFIGAELHRREPDGAWPADPILIGPEDTLCLTSIDFAVPLREIYARTHLA